MAVICENKISETVALRTVVMHGYGYGDSYKLGNCYHKIRLFVGGRILPGSF